MKMSNYTQKHEWKKLVEEYVWYDFTHTYDGA